MIRRYREPGSRRDLFARADDVWYESIAPKDGTLSVWTKTMSDGVRTFGLDSAVGRRLDEMPEFFVFIYEEMPALLERWRVRRDKLRSELG